MIVAKGKQNVFAFLHAPKSKKNLKKVLRRNILGIKSDLQSKS